LFFAMLSVAVACTMRTSLCSSRYQQAAPFLQHALSRVHSDKLNSTELQWLTF